MLSRSHLSCTSDDTGNTEEGRLIIMERRRMNRVIRDSCRPRETMKEDKVKRIGKSRAGSTTSEANGKLET
jgi:hypothetical protein